jgi:hypothetical protein
MLANEFFDRSRRPASEIGDRAGDRHRLAARMLVGRNREGALEIALADRGLFYQVLLPEFSPNSAETCHGEIVKTLSVEMGLSTNMVLLYVAAIRFADGSSWHMPSHDEFEKRITTEWRRVATQGW